MGSCGFWRVPSRIRSVEHSSVDEAAHRQRRPLRVRRERPRRRAAD